METLKHLHVKKVKENQDDTRGRSGSKMRCLVRKQDWEGYIVPLIHLQFVSLWMSIRCTDSPSCPRGEWARLHNNVCICLFVVWISLNKVWNCQAQALLLQPMLLLPGKYVINLSYYFILFLKDFYLCISERGEGKKRGRDTSICSCPSCTPHWGPGPQPRHVPWLRIKPGTPWFAGQHSIHWATPARAQCS